MENIAALETDTTKPRDPDVPVCIDPTTPPLFFITILGHPAGDGEMAKFFVGMRQ